MNKQELEYIRAQISQVKSMLSMVNDHAVMKKSMESLLKKWESKLLKMKYTVAKIDVSDAMTLNNGLDDDNKVAFQDAAGTSFYIKDPSVYPTSLHPSKYKVTQITQAEVDGTFPATKPKRIYP